MSEKIDQLSIALNKMQSEITGAQKNKTNAFFKNSNYADLESVWNAVREPLTKNGLAIIQSLDGEDMVTLLTHTSGQWIETTAKIASKDHNDPQKIMAAFTYFRRGNLAGFTGTPQVDDDGNSAARSDAPVDAKQPKFDEQEEFPPFDSLPDDKPKKKDTGPVPTSIENVVYPVGEWKGKSFKVVIDTYPTKILGRCQYFIDKIQKKEKVDAWVINFIDYAKSRGYEIR